MQKLAGLITESQYRESINEEETIFANYSTNNDNSIKTKLARNLAEEIHSFDAKEGTIESLFTGEMEQYEEGDDDFYANKEEALKAFAELPNTFTIIHNIDGDKVKISITKTGPKSWKVNESESQLNENKLYAMLATVADDLGEDSGIYNALKDAVIDGLDENGKLSPEGKIEIKNLLKGDLLDDYGHFLDENVNEGDTDYDRAKDAKRLGKKGEKNIYGAGVEKGEEIEKKKMKMSELKAAIKELALSEGEDDVNFNDDESLYDPVYEGVWSVLPARVPEFIQKIKDIKDEYHAVVGSDDVYDGLDHAISAAEKLMSSELSEAKKDEEVKSDKFTIGTDKSNPLHPSFFVYNTETGEKSKVFKTKKEAEELMNSKLNEAKKDEEVEDIKDVDVTVGDEETTADVTTVDVDPNVKAVQDALTQAQAAAEKLGDEKLTDQIGNTITFFTRTHVVDKPGMTAESNIKERINKLIKSL
jgi:hypothetical protein